MPRRQDFPWQNRGEQIEGLTKESAMNGGKRFTLLNQQSCYVNMAITPATPKTPAIISLLTVGCASAIPVELELGAVVLTLVFGVATAV